MRVRDNRSRWRRRWSAHEFPADMDDAAMRLSALLLDKLDHQGAVREPCRSRVLESALMLRLLQRTGLEAQRAEPIARFLERRRAGGDDLERLLIACALDGWVAPDDPMVTQFLARVPSFTGARKRAFLAAVFSLFGGPRSYVEHDPTAFSLDGLHSWAAVQVTALKTILAQAADRPDMISTSDLALLASTQRTSRVWEGYVLVHLLVLHALAARPGAHDEVVAGVRKALVHQGSDGGMPFVANSDIWCTASAGIALHTIGGPSRHGLRRTADYLVAQQQPDGLWAHSEEARQTDVDDSSVCLELLHLVDPSRHREAIDRGLEAVRATQGADGGFPTYVLGASSECSMTAASINALSLRPHRYERVTAAAFDFLIANQQADGLFGPDWSRSRFHTVFRTLLAADRAPRSFRPLLDGLVQRATGCVRDAQNADGGWGQQAGDASDAISTAYALIALCGQDEPRPVADGVRYLLEHRRCDGSVVSVSDMIGPRPFAIEIPVLADIYALLSMGHVAAELRGRPQCEEPPADVLRGETYGSARARPKSPTSDGGGRR